MKTQKLFQLEKQDLKKISEIIKKGEKGRIISRAIVLKMKDKNYTNMEAAEIAGVTPRTVINICQYYLNGGLEAALVDDPRPGKPPKLDDRIKSKIVALVCSNPPEGFDRWTLDLIKEKTEKRGIVNKISQESVRLILREHDLKPWQYKMWCVSKINPEYVNRMEKILDLYEKRYNRKQPVICLDEKSVSLCGDKRKSLSFSKGHPNRMDYEYSRNGSANVFCAVEPTQGVYINQVRKRKKKEDFGKFLKLIHNEYKEAEKIHLVMDNYCTHKEKSLIETFGRKEGKKIWERFKIYFTPVHASWLNQAEMAVGMYSRQCLGHTRIDNIELLEKKTKSWNKAINEKKIEIKWRFTKKNAKEKFSYK